MAILHENKEQVNVWRTSRAKPCLPLPQVSGSNLIPFEAPEQIAMLAVFTLLQLPQTTGVDRNKVFQLQQNATGVNVTYLTVVRPTAATLDFPTVSRNTSSSKATATGLCNSSTKGPLRWSHSWPRSSHS